MAKVVFKLEGEAADAVSAFLKVEDKAKALEQRAESLKRKTGQMTREGTAGFSDWKSAAGGLVTQFMTVGGVIAGMTKAMQAFNAERKEAMTGMMAASKSFGQLGQLSGGSPERLAGISSASWPSVSSATSYLSSFRVAGPAIESRRSNGRKTESLACVTRGLSPAWSERIPLSITVRSSISSSCR